MEGEPRNAASDLARYGFSQMHEPDFVAGLADRLTDDFAHTDRRKLVGLGSARKHSTAVGYALLHELGGPAEVTVEGVLAVHGRRLVALEVRHTFTDRDIYIDEIYVIQYDRPVFLTERVISFDVDDSDAAIVELDRLHAALESEDT